MALSGYFMSKSVFVQHSCHALIFALARLSCLSLSSFMGHYKNYHSLVRSTIVHRSLDH